MSRRRALFTIAFGNSAYPREVKMIAAQVRTGDKPGSATTQRPRSGGAQLGDSSMFCPNTTTAVDADQIVFCEEDENRAVYEVIDGVLKLYKLTPDGRIQIVGFAYPGQLLGLTGEPHYTVTAESITKVKLCRYPRQSFQRMIDESPAVAKRLLAMVAKDLSSAQSWMLLLGRKSAIEKVASFLVWLSQSNVSRGRDPCELELPMRRADIGDYLGLTTETTSRALSRLRQMGHIDLNHPHAVLLRDIDELSELAEGEPRAAA